MINSLKESYKLTNKYIILATPLILFSLLSSLYILFSVKGNVLGLLFAIVLFFLMLIAFLSGWFYMIKNAISDCESDEFDCYIIHREPSPAGARLNGNPISLVELASMLEPEENMVEIFLELYDFNYLYWRGVLLPHKEQGLSDNVVIEASGCFPMTYWWE